MFSNHKSDEAAAQGDHRDPSPRDAGTADPVESESGSESVRDNPPDHSLPHGLEEYDNPSSAEPPQDEVHREWDSQPAEESSDPPRYDLNRIVTPWTQLELAAGGPVPSQVPEVVAAQQAILTRYGIAIHRYLVAITKDENLARDLGQEFALRFLQGQFKAADRERGRFRHYLKRVISNLVVDVYRRADRERRAMDNVAQQRLTRLEATRPDLASLNAIWRSHLLALAWRELEKESRDNRPPYFQVLKLRVEFPDDNSQDLATRLNELVSGQYSSSATRQLLSRARQRFRELLWSEISKSTGSHEREQIEQEIGDLGLKKYFNDQDA